MSTEQRKIYIAGPMSGYPEFNFPAFFAAEEKLKAEGYIVFNPANKDQEKTIDPESYATGDNVLLIERGFDFREAYLWDIERVIEGDGIYMLPGWERSPGACGEHAVAVTMQKHYPDYEIRYESRTNAN